MDCECGSHYQYQRKTNHLKSIKHIKYVNNLEIFINKVNDNKQDPELYNENLTELENKEFSIKQFNLVYKFIDFAKIKGSILIGSFIDTFELKIIDVKQLEDIENAVRQYLDLVISSKRYGKDTLFYLSAPIISEIFVKIGIGFTKILGKFTISLLDELIEPIIKYY